MTRVRLRQHVNPLSHKYRSPIMPPDWSQVYANPTQLLHLDIGCARGKFLLSMAQLHPQINFLGVEIREALVIEANQHCDKLGLKNLYFLFGNINYNPAVLFEALPSFVLQWVTIQFPDPWFKRHHRKRRVVQPELVETIAKFLREGGEVFLQSDVEILAGEMRDRFQSYPDFQPQHSQTWLEINPFPVSTEREIATLAHNEPVYRVLLARRQEAGAEGRRK